MTLPLPVARAVRDHFGSEVAHARAIAGGCIHECRRLKLVDGSCYFLKFQPASHPDLLTPEADGLNRLSAHLRVPAVRGQGATDGHRWLALEWLDLRPHDARSLHALGGALGAMHALPLPSFGAEGPGYLGATPVDNRLAANWREFFITRRLEPFLRAVASRGESLPTGRIMAVAAILLRDHQPAPSLLHGDLWIGNTAAIADGAPVVFDPSAHAGDAECDLAMLEQFGGPLPPAFLAAYGEHGPVLQGRSARRPLYDLIHACNHYLLFGSSYRGMINHCLDDLI